jgi:hypothetical protein
VTPADLALAGYAMVIGVALVTVRVRQGPTLLRGTTALIFTAAYAAVAWALLAWRGGDVPLRVAAAAAIALVLSAMMTPWWFVFGGSRSGALAIVQGCFPRVCANYEGTDTGFVMQVPGGQLRIDLRALPVTRITLLSFRASPRHRKGDLLRGLVRKQYPAVLPTIRIRIR